MKVTGALAWNAQVNMSQAEIDDFLSGRWVARLATIGGDGYPVVVPLWYYWDGRSLFFSLTTSRMAYKNLARNPRCSAVIDMDERPLIGMRHNLAKAVVLVGDVELAHTGTADKVTLESGPFAGAYSADDALGFITQRYRISERDGAVGFTYEAFSELWNADGSGDSELVKQSQGRVIAKLRPKRVRAWDFSKAPMGAE